MNYNVFKIVYTKNIDNSKINSTICTGGRFGNIFIKNMISSRIAKLNNLKFIYEKQEEMNKLGITYYTEGTNIYEKTLLITDNIIDKILFDNKNYNNYLRGNNIFFKQENYQPFIKQDYAWCQTSTIAKFIKERIDYQQDNIINSNPFFKNYNNNNSVFVHVRLGDIVELGFSTNYEYYDYVLSLISFETGYISSDSIDHEICKKLILKYKLIIYNDNEINTIQFASTNKYIILSSGTFSWLIGIFSFFSEVYYPKIKVIWHGDIFVFPKWKEINI